MSSALHWSVRTALIVQGPSLTIRRARSVAIVSFGVAREVASSR